MANDLPAMERRGPHVTESEVAAFELRLGCALVEDYRQFLLDVNGGRLARANRRCAFGVINELFSVDDPDDDGNLEVAMRYAADLPGGGLLYIGYTGTGGRILLALSGPQRGEVWFQTLFDRPEGSNSRVDPFKRRDMERLASSFSELLRSLEPLDRVGYDK